MPARPSREDADALEAKRQKNSAESETLSTRLFPALDEGRG